jgi:putative SOS response-associated peptidase YedK
MIFTNSDQRILSGIWGVGKPLAYNAKIESLRGTWKAYMNKRGILELDAFFEKNFRFERVDGSPLIVPIIYNKDYDFLVLTRPAKAPVLGVHDRQPCLIKAGEENQWLENTKIIQMELGELQKMKQVA